jgi:hypothetical protein
MMTIKKVFAWLLLALSTLGGLISVYVLLFAIWMSAHPRYDSEAWHIRYYERLAITVLDGIIWVGSIVWLFRLGGKHEKAGSHADKNPG